MTYEDILERMLDNVPTDVDKREGSVIYDALAPCAAELAQMYAELEQFRDECFADTASRPFLIRRAAERGLSPKSATYAVLSAEFNVSVPVGARFSLDGLNYAVTDDNVVTCETAGAEGNRHFGQALPIDFIEGLETAKITALLIPGEDEEDTETFRQRYFGGMSEQAFGGNITDYKQKANALDGVGGVKVYPVWDGGGTVKLVLISSDWNAPSAELIDSVQTAIDPTRDGRGIGIAPIGHIVTVIGADEVSVNISAKITWEEGWDYAAAKDGIEEAVDGVLLALRQSWADNSALIVRVSRIEQAILGCAGVVDIAETALNGSAANLVLGADELPIRGDISEIT